MQRYAVTGSADWQRPSVRQRFGALGLTVLIEIVVLLIVLAFGAARTSETVVSMAPTSVTFLPNAAPARAPQQRKAAADAPAKTAPPAPARPRPPIVLPVRDSLPFVPLSKADMAASDISKLGTAGKPAEAGQGQGTKVASGPGEGPGGVQLYNAEWVVEPSDAELRGYLPGRIDRGSWALIACQTIAHNRVENCAQLGESPRGSGLSKAMRLAAWQFKIRPPRIDGKPMVGAWVRVRIDFTKGDGEPGE